MMRERKMNLYDMKSQYLSILDELTANEDLTPEIIRDTLALYEDEIAVKIENTAMYIEAMQADLKAIKEAADKMHDKHARLAKKIYYLTDYLLKQMEALNMNKVKGKILNVSVRENPYKVIVADEDKIPKEYITIRTIEQHNLDKIKIRDDILAGKHVEGAELVKDKRLLISM